MAANTSLATRQLEDQTKALKSQQKATRDLEMGIISFQHRMASGEESDGEESDGEKCLPEVMPDYFVYCAREMNITVIKTTRENYNAEDHFTGYNNDCQWGEVKSHIHTAVKNMRGRDLLYAYDPDSATLYRFSAKEGKLVGQLDWYECFNSYHAKHAGFKFHDDTLYGHYEGYDEETDDGEESDGEEEPVTPQEYCNAGEHYVDAQDMWHDLGDCMGCTSAKEREELLEEED